MEKIVIGISDEASQRAVDWVIGRAKRGPLDVNLVLSFDLAMSDPLDDQHLLEAAKRRIGDASPSSRVRTALVERSIPESILPFTLDADLLVLGTRHRGFLARAFAGSPALELAARSHCATVIVPETWTPTSGGRIVVGLEDDGSSDAALDFAAREAVFEHSHMEIVHVWSNVLPGVATMEWMLVDERQMHAMHEGDLTAAVSRIRASTPESRVTGLIAEGTPPAAILSDHSTGTDLFVIGSHRRGPLGGILLGSTAADMLRSLRIPLCIVPPAGRPSGAHAPQLGSIPLPA